MAAQTGGSGQGTTRLDRLLTLLDTGSTSTIRRAAAKQIGELAHVHPSQLHPLLCKVQPYLRSRSWDTRVAAAQAIGSVAQNVPCITVQQLRASAEAALGIHITSSQLTKLAVLFEDLKEGSNPSQLGFRSFDVLRVLETGAPLVASGGQEFDIRLDSSISAKERASRQKQNLQRRLGLDGCEQFMDMNDIIRDEDLITSRDSVKLEKSPSRGSGKETSKQGVEELVARMAPAGKSLQRSMSARERNLLKRKARAQLREGVRAGPMFRSPSDSGPPAKRICTEPTTEATSQGSLIQESEISAEEEEDGSWPFTQLSEELIVDMFSPVWEVRHGSVMALREILSTQAASAGVCGVPEESQSKVQPTAGQVSAVPAPVAQSVIMESKPDGSKGTVQAFDLNLEVQGVEEVDLEGTGGRPTSAVDAKQEQKAVAVKKEDTDEHIEPRAVVELDRKVGLKMDNTPLSSLKEHNMELLKAAVPDSMAVDLKSLQAGSHVEVALKTACLAEKSNLDFLQDCCIRVLCIFALDRFGDFVADQVVAPVRETSAQVLAAVAKFLPPNLVHETLSVLLQMQGRPEWEVRHGSLLGIKYLVAVRQDLLSELLPRVLPACMGGLEDADDDVRAVAAEALAPAVKELVRTSKCHVTPILATLWDILLDLDDLSPSTGSMMNLLAQLYSQPGVSPVLGAQVISLAADEGVASSDKGLGDSDEDLAAPASLAELAPRLWPFLRHNVTAVRLAAIRTLECLLEAGGGGQVEGARWIEPLLQDALQLVLRNLLLEEDPAILDSSQRVWRLLLMSNGGALEAASAPCICTWLQLAATPAGTRLDTACLLPRKASSQAKGLSKRKSKGQQRARANGSQAGAIGRESVGSCGQAGASTVALVGASGEDSAIRMRLAVAEALGQLAARWPLGSLHLLTGALLGQLQSPAGIPRQVAGMVVVSWFRQLRRSSSPDVSKVVAAAAQSLRQALMRLLSAPSAKQPSPDNSAPYAEMAKTYDKLQSEAGALVRHAHAAAPSLLATQGDSLQTESMDAEAAVALALSLEGAAHRCALGHQAAAEAMEACRQRLLLTAGYLKAVEANLHGAVQAVLAGAVVWMGELPGKLNPIIQPLMSAIRREQEQALQQQAAIALAEVVASCVGRKPSPNDKLLRNVCILTCADPAESPSAIDANADCDELEEAVAEAAKAGEKGAGRRVRLQDQDEQAAAAAAQAERELKEGSTTRRGAELALQALGDSQGAALLDKLPRLWDCLTEALPPQTGVAQEAAAVPLPELAANHQALANNLQLLRSASRALPSGAQGRLLTLLPAVVACVRHTHAVVRGAAAKCIAAMAAASEGPVMAAVLAAVIPMLADPTSERARKGAARVIAALVGERGAELAPYAGLLVVPLLGRMSDPCTAVRQSATCSFAELLPLLPLARGLPTPPLLGAAQEAQAAQDARFLEQLLDNKQAEDYQIQFPLPVSLRPYQQEGVNWLAFLHRFGLHGILCDDMGLGKTLQASIMVASDAAERARQFDNTAGTEGNPLPSLVVCPPTLVAHWAFEIEKYIPPQVLHPVQYMGTAAERAAIRSQLTKPGSLVITSYEVLRADVAFLAEVVWSYCVLDEGHVIKSAKSKLAQAAKRMQAQHRLILSGTPIQNNVGELWSLFDFLMPGFLGTERQFLATYGKPLAAARDPKCSPQQSEAGVLAMEALHRQVMPFLLRRTKEQVLKDLPPKIIQDRFCQPSALQKALYEDFSQSGAKQGVEAVLEVADAPGSGASTHVFQALQYLRSLCSHPLLALNRSQPRHMAAVQAEAASAALQGLDLAAAKDLHDLRHSPKLLALRDILEECGIGTSEGLAEEPLSSDDATRHRVLVFCQLKAFMDIIEEDLLRRHMPSVTYLRLDGSVEASRRFGIVRAFNSDPTIDLLLLTTHVGGLGLNLTAADTVVFMEHDWNPMRDLQAMDRAHRLGQRRTVNVHRLITTSTLEEKIMSLQRFKLSVAGAVVNADNASLSTMDTGRLLDLFSVGGAQPGKKPAGPTDAAEAAGHEAAVGQGKGLKALLTGLEELWDESQYKEEYDISAFVSRLNG